MQVGLKSLMLTVALSLLAAGGASAGAASTQDPQPGGDFSKLTLDLDLPRTEFIKLEPVPITLTLSNRTGRPIVGHTAIGISEGRFTLFVGRGGGAPREFRNPTHLNRNIAIRDQEIMPGERHQRKELLMAFLGEVFPESGTYLVWAVVDDGKYGRAVKSNAATLRVLDPEGVDLRAYEYLRSGFNPPSYIWGPGTFQPPVGPERLREFVERFGGSAYWDLAAYMLGSWHYTRGDTGGAKALLGAVAKKADFFYADHAARLLSQIEGK